MCIHCWTIWGCKPYAARIESLLVSGDTVASGEILLAEEYGGAWGEDDTVLTDGKEAEADELRFGDGAALACAPPSAPNNDEAASACNPPETRREHARKASSAPQARWHVMPEEVDRCCRCPPVGKT